MPRTARPLVLIVDGAELSRSIAVAAVSGQGVDVIEAASIETALAEVEQYAAPDVLFIDLGADIDGQVERLLSLTRARNPAIQVLLASRAPLDAPPPSIAAQLSKPYLLEDLRRELRRALDA